ncbi:unnamed protein product [Nesidiocoris tenuis]|uniref:CNNM transmembrane domain-containing protein n=1 Tax=Nesidiocoris tenuis TaxID=355587 RepID=A0A6H5GLI4_9HEMI|nr:unnamed protein product [Nesidiocoris tenuis]
MAIFVNFFTVEGRGRRDAATIEPPRLYGLKVESADDWNLGDDSVPEIRLGSKAIVRMFGDRFTSETRFVLTSKSMPVGSHCEFPASEEFKIISDPSAAEQSQTSVLVNLQMPVNGLPNILYYFCCKQFSANESSSPSSSPHNVWMHLGTEAYQAVRSYDKLLPSYISIIIIIGCLCFSALFSGLNLGLMSIDRTDLKIIQNTGTKQERKYAAAIAPVRSHGNYLLCSILLGNVMVNSTFTILLDDLTSGLVAVVASTLLIVVFGEISPQAICSRHGLAVGAKTIWITKTVMVVTFPLSFPISKILDLILGEEIGAVYTRERLKELVKLTTEYNDLQKDEVNIISGALDLCQKQVKEVMTVLDDVYMLPIDAILDFETVSEIMASGFSRIPVFEGRRSNVVSLLYIKDLALIDPDDNIPLKTHCEFYQSACFFVFEDMTLDVVFKSFKDGARGHMAFVHRVNNEGEGDPFYETVGLITLEDVIEELIQSEINDETDVYTDNRSKRRRKERTIKTDYKHFAGKSENQKIHVSPQLALAAFQFLTTTVEAFKPESVSEVVLRRLLLQDIYMQIKVKDKSTLSKDDPSLVIYEQHNNNYYDHHYYYYNHSNHHYLIQTTTITTTTTTPTATKATTITTTTTPSITTIMYNNNHYNNNLQSPPQHPPLHTNNHHYHIQQLPQQQQSTLPQSRQQPPQQYYPPLPQQ